MSDDQDGRGSLPPEILESVAADLVATLGWPVEEAEVFVRRDSGAWCAGVPRLLLVAEDVQQRLHDDRIDITWPACPDHPNHPLRLSDTLPAVWACPSSGYPVCPLGGLAALSGVGVDRGPEPFPEQTGGAGVYGDRTHRFVAPPGVIFDALTIGQDNWLVLAPGETAPEVIEYERPHRVVWSSLWPVSPGDTIEFKLTRYGAGTEVRFIWRSPSPPDDRGVGITRQRLNRKLGSDLRAWTDSGSSPISWDPPPTHT